MLYGEITVLIEEDNYRLYHGSKDIWVKVSITYMLIVKNLPTWIQTFNYQHNTEYEL